MVTGIDDFSTGRCANLDEVRERVGAERFSRFRMVEGDVASADICREAVSGAELVLHQAALGSVPRSIQAPLESNAANVTGHLALLEAARQAGIRRFVYASSSSVYGDSEALPKLEPDLGRPLSPYAVTKLANELYAGVYGELHGMETVGLRYFNVFGPRQDPEGAYAAVIPKWVAAMIRGERVLIHGTGETSRDFCYVANVVQANLLAATASSKDVLNQAYNVAAGRRTRDRLGDLVAIKRRLGESFLEFERVGNRIVIGQVVVNVSWRWRLKVFKKFRARSVEGQPTLDEHHHAVEHTKGGEQVGRDDDRRALIGELAEEHHHQGFGAGVEAGRGLVEEEHAGLGQQLDADAHALSLASAQRRHRIVPALRV